MADWMEKRPQDNEGRTLLAVSLFEAGRYADAKAAYERAVSLRAARLRLWLETRARR